MPNPIHSTRHPDKLMEEFRAGLAGKADIDVEAVFWEIIGDILDTVRLSAGTWSEHAGDIYAEVLDYIVNNYGDDS